MAGHAKGVAFRIAAAKLREELGILWQREMYGGAYHARWVRLTAGDEKISAVTFVINRDNPRYIKELTWRRPRPSLRRVRIGELPGVS